MYNKAVNIFIFLIACIVPLVITPGYSDYYYLPKITIIYMLCLILILYLIINTKLKEIKINTFLLLYVLSVSASFMFSIDKTTSLWGKPLRCEGLLAFISYAVIYTAAANFYKIKKSCVDLFLLSAFLIALYGIFQYFGYDFIPKDPRRIKWVKIAFSTIGNPNFLGSYIVLVLPVSVFMWINFCKKRYLLLSCIFYMCLLCTRTRSAWLGFIFSFALMIIFNIKDKINMKHLYIAIAFFTAITIFLNFYGQNETEKKFVSIISDAEKVYEKSPKAEYAGSTRIFIWKRAVKLIKSRPILGYGPDTFGIVFMNNYKKDILYVIGNEIIDKAHNEYLETAVTCGLVTLAFYILFIFDAIKKSYRSINKNKYIIPVLLGISGYLVQAFFNISVVSVAPVFWAMLGILSSLSNEVIENES